jgi:hypothetical protein
MSFTIRYNGSTTHIEGCDAATQSTGEERGGVVSYYAQSACGSLTRYGHSMAVGKSYEDAAEALEAGRANAAASGRKFCKKCEIAAKWAVANAPFDPESDEFKDEKKRVNDELIARSEAAKIKRAAAEQAEPTKPEPFTFEYDALTGISVAAALLEKAEAEHRDAKAHRLNASLDDKMTGYYAEQARLAENRAKLLEDAADAIRTPVRVALAEDMGRALDAAEEKPFHRTVKDAIGLRW